MKVFLSGPVSSVGRSEAERLFNIAEEHLKKIGFIVLNPTSIPVGLTEPEYMDICLSMLRCCDAIHLINGYQDSSGSAVELAYAKKLGLIIMNER